MSVGHASGYQLGAVATASPARLVTMLYDAAIAATARAGQSLANSPGPEALDLANTELTRAQDIVLELQLSLDHELGGEIAGTLATLYDFCLDRLVRANVAKDPLLLTAVESVLFQLRDAWTEAAEQAGVGD